MSWHLIIRLYEKAKSKLNAITLKWNKIVPTSKYFIDLFIGEEATAKEQESHHTLVLDQNGDGIRVENKVPV